MWVGFIQVQFLEFMKYHTQINSLRPPLHKKRIDWYCLNLKFVYHKTFHHPLEHFSFGVFACCIGILKKTHFFFVFHIIQGNNKSWIKILIKATKHKFFQIFFFFSVEVNDDWITSLKFFIIIDLLEDNKYWFFLNVLIQINKKASEILRGVNPEQLIT